MKLSVAWKWFDLWVGAYWDVGHRTLYVCPVPTVVLRFEFRGPKDESKHRADRTKVCELGFESELDLESLMPKSQHNDILDMVRRTEVEPLKAENARLAAETTRLLDALIAADYILGRVQTITLKGDDNPPKYYWGEAADLVHSTLFQYQLEYAASQPQKPDRTEGIDSLKAENARLAAASEKLALACEQICSPIRPHWRTTLEAASSALAEYREIARLRAAMGEK